MANLNEIHELPLANRLIDQAIREWLDRHFSLQFAQQIEGSPEWKALQQARYVGLDGYSYQVTPAILKVLHRAGLLIAKDAHSGQEGE